MYNIKGFFMCTKYIKYYCIIYMKSRDLHRHKMSCVHAMHTIRYNNIYYTAIPYTLNILCTLYILHRQVPTMYPVLRIGIVLYNNMIYTNIWVPRHNSMCYA